MPRETVWRVYARAIDPGMKGSQVAIAMSLAISPACVRYHLKNLMRDGYVRRLGNTNPATYRRTSLPPPKGDIGDIPPPPPHLRSHHTSRIFDVTHPPTRLWPWFWDKDWNPSGSCQYFLVRGIDVDTGEGSIMCTAIRYIEDRSLTIWFDKRRLVTPEQVMAHDDVATEMAELVGHYVHIKTGICLANLRAMQASHFAMDVPPDVWIDKSLGTPEYETNNKDKAELWLRFPEVVDDLNAKIAFILAHLGIKYKDGKT